MFKQIKTYENDYAVINIDFMVCIMPCIELTTNEKQEIVDRKVDSYFIKMSNGENIKIKKSTICNIRNSFKRVR